MEERRIRDQSGIGSDHGLPMLFGSSHIPSGLRLLRQCLGEARIARSSLRIAHIGAESEFHQNGEIACPKCRQKGLVAGSDFEVVPGGFACSDCGSRTSEPQLIGHCLSCQHRFFCS